MRMRPLNGFLGLVVAWSQPPTEVIAQDLATIQQQLRAEDVQVRREAATAILHANRDIQRAVLPIFIDLLKSEKDGQVRLAVLDTCIALGPDASPAVTALVETLKTDYGGQQKEELHQDYRSALALAGIGRPAVAGLREVLASRKVNVRAEAAMALGRIGPDAKAAIPDLIRLLGDESERVCREAALALGRIGPASEGPLGEAAANESVSIRARALDAIGHLESPGARLRELVLESALDQAPEVRAAAITALARFEVPEDILLPLLVDTLADSEDNVRLSAVNLLADRRDLLTRIAPRLDALLLSENEGVSRHAAFLLRTLGPDAVPALLAAMAHKESRIDQIALEVAQVGRPAVEPLTRALASTEPRVRQGAALALGQIRPPAPGVLDTLSAGLEDPDADVRAAFLGAIGHLGLRGAPALPAIRALLRDDSAENRRRAIDVLFGASRRDERLVGDVSACLVDDDPRVQERALRVIRSLGPIGRPALSAAIELLSSPHLEVRQAAVELIGSHGPTAAEAVPALAVLLEDPSPELRAAAAQTLGMLGTAARPALPRLILLLSLDQPVAVRAAVASTLGNLEPDAETIRPHLAASLRAEEPEVRRAALGAIQRLGPRGALFIPDIIRLAEIPDERRSVERSLRRYERSGPDSRSVPELIAQLGHHEEAVRLLAIRFLGLAGPEAKDALVALARLRDDPSAEVRKQAEIARDRIQSGSRPAS